MHLLLWHSLPKFSKRALLALAWAYTPRKLKLVVGGAAAVVLTLLVGALAVTFFVLNQLLA